MPTYYYRCCPKKKDAPASPVIPTADKNPLQVQKDVFRQAMRYSDFTTAAIALNYIIAIDPAQKAYKDTLALVYAELGANVQALSVSKDVLATDPNNALMLEVAAGAEEALGLVKESLEDYEKLYKISNRIYHLYKVATMQYYLKRFGECAVTLNTLLAAKDVNTEKIAMNYERQRQEVPLSAAVYNMRGMVAMELNDPKAAKDNFNEALKIMPDFSLAKGNIALVDKIEADKNAPVTQPAPANNGVKGGK